MVKLRAKKQAIQRTTATALKKENFISYFTAMAVLVL